jgi:hypothetical protein
MIDDSQRALAETVFERWLDETRAAIGTGLAFNAKFSIRRVRAFGESDNPVFLAQRERMIEAMRMAGAPDG